MPENTAVVLVVDDDPDMRDVLESALTSFGYTTLVADDGDTAWALYEEHKPDLVLSDIYMPRMDGVSLLQRVQKAEGKKAAVILITGYSHIDALENDGGPAPDALLRKPFSLSDLFKTIQRVQGASE